MPRSRPQSSVLRQLRGLAVLSVVTIVTLIALVTASEVHQRAVYTPERDRLYAAEQGLDHLYGGMLDQETGIRGYLGTGDRVFLQPYESGQHETLRGLAALAASVQDPLGRRLLDDVQVAASAWEQEYAEATVARTETDFTAARDAARATEGKRLFDAFRDAHRQLDAHLEARTADVVETRDQVRTALLAGALVLLLLLGALGTHQLRTARRLVGPPVAHLAERARAAVDAQPQPQPQPLPAELTPIGTAVDGLVAQLQEARDVIARQAGQLRQADRATGLLLDQTRLLTSAAAAPTIAATTAEAARSLLDGRQVTVWLAAGDDRSLAYSSSGRPDRAEDGARARPQDVAERALHFGRVFVDVEGATLAAPMISEGRALGVVEVLLPAGAEPDARELDALQVLLSQGAAALASARLLAVTSELSLRDPLTGLANRRQLEQDLAEVDRSAGEDVGLLVVDVDRFKHFNDTRGHAAGDDLLRSLGSVLSAAVRADTGDSVYRYGGEEFVVLLRGCARQSLAQSAERLRESVARRLATHGVTVSVGAASGRGRPVTALFRSADAALYRAKAEGRNRVVVAEDPEGEVGSRSDAAAPERVR